MTRLAVVLGVVLVAVVFAGRAYAATYYVSPLGDDTKAGTSPDAAWRTLGKVNNTRLRPGDSVLLQAGANFAGPLVPWGAGSAKAPVRIASYGQGRATVSSVSNNILFLHDVSWLTIENLHLTANDADMHVVVSDPSTTSSNVTIRGNLIDHTGAFGINSPSLTDHDWTIQGNTVTDTGETGITFRGSDFKVIGNVVVRTGRHPSEAAHGIYAKGPRAQVIGNVIDTFDSSGISIRYQDSVARGNLIVRGLIGISYFQDKAVTTGGISTIAYNRIADVSTAGIFLDGSTLEGFVVANNTIRTSAGNGLNLHRVKSLTLVNNIVTGTFDDYAALLRRPVGAYVEHHNLWFPGTDLLWQGVARSLDAYRKASGQGAGDVSADPKLGRTLAPLRGSPVLDAGVVQRGLGYRRACDGKAFSYCGRAPDIGAIERKS